jgi:hypothetical protein
MDRCFEGVWDGSTWNGFATPRFDRFSIEGIAQYWPAFDGGEASFEDGVLRLEHSSNGDVGEFFPDRDGLYSLEGLCWEEVTRAHSMGRPGRPLARSDERSGLSEREIGAGVEAYVRRLIRWPRKRHLAAHRQTGSAGTGYSGIWQCYTRVKGGGLTSVGPNVWASGDGTYSARGKGYDR